MGNLTVRNLDDRVIEQLKAQARANQRSLEGEVRHVLAQQVDRPGRIADFRERTRRLVSLTADTSQSDSVDLLREDREGSGSVSPRTDEAGSAFRGSGHLARNGRKARDCSSGRDARAREVLRKSQQLDPIAKMSASFR